MRIVRAAIEILRLALSRDRLGFEPGQEPARTKKAPGVLHVLLVSREPLGLDPEPQRTRRSVLHALFAPERLPLDPEPAPRRKGRLVALFAREKLEDEP